MSTKDLESLSALLDNEANELDLPRVLKALEQDPEVAKTWERINLVQAVLHGEDMQDVQKSPYVQLLSNDFQHNVATVISGEPGLAKSPAAVSNWGHSLAKFGIAASVALAFFLGMQTTVNQQPDSVRETLPLAQQADHPATESDSTVTSQNEFLVAESPLHTVDPQARQRLEDYIRSVSISPREPAQLEQLQDSPLFRLVNEIQNNQ